MKLSSKLVTNLMTIKGSEGALKIFGYRCYFETFTKLNPKLQLESEIKNLLAAIVSVALVLLRL